MKNSQKNDFQRIWIQLISFFFNAESIRITPLEPIQKGMEKNIQRQPPS